MTRSARRTGGRYARLAGDFLHVIRRQHPGVSLVWISPVPLRNAQAGERVRNTAGVLRNVLSGLNIPYIDLMRADRLGSVFRPLTLRGRSLRTEDGIHLTRAGGRYVAAILLSETGAQP